MHAPAPVPTPHVQFIADDPLTHMMKTAEEKKCISASSLTGFKTMGDNNSVAANVNAPAHVPRFAEAKRFIFDTSVAESKTTEELKLVVESATEEIKSIVGKVTEEIKSLSERISNTPFATILKALEQPKVVVDGQLSPKPASDNSLMISAKTTVEAEPAFAASVLSKRVSETQSATKAKNMEILEVAADVLVSLERTADTPATATLNSIKESKSVVDVLVIAEPEVIEDVQPAFNVKSNAQSEIAVKAEIFTGQTDTVSQLDASLQLGPALPSESDSMAEETKSLGASGPSTELEPPSHAEPFFLSGSELFAESKSEALSGLGPASESASLRISGSFTPLEPLDQLESFPELAESDNGSEYLDRLEHLPGTERLTRSDVSGELESSRESEPLGGSEHQNILEPHSDSQLFGESEASNESISLDRSESLDGSRLTVSVLNNRIGFHRPDPTDQLKQSHHIASVI